MLKDSKDLLDSVEVTTIAAECTKVESFGRSNSEQQKKILKDLKLKADDVGSRVIPELLAEQALTSIKMEDGSTVSVKKEFRATIPKDEGKKRGLPLQWLRDQGLGDIIKNNVSVTFGKGEDDKAEQLLNLAAEHGFEPQQKSDVAWNTLTALYQERVQAGMDMPSECFSLWIKDKTKISRKK